MMITSHSSLPLSEREADALEDIPKESRKASRSFPTFLIRVQLAHYANADGSLDDDSPLSDEQMDALEELELSWRKAIRRLPLSEIRALVNAAMQASSAGDLPSTVPETPAASPTRVSHSLPTPSNTRPFEKAKQTSNTNTSYRQRSPLANASKQQLKSAQKLKKKDQQQGNPSRQKAAADPDDSSDKGVDSDDAHNEDSDLDRSTDLDDLICSEDETAAELPVNQGQESAPILKSAQVVEDGDTIKLLFPEPADLTVAAMAKCGLSLQAQIMGKHHVRSQLAKSPDTPLCDIHKSDEAYQHLRGQIRAKLRSSKLFIEGVTWSKISLIDRGKIVQRLQTWSKKKKFLWYKDKKLIEALCQSICQNCSVTAKRRVKREEARKNKKRKTNTLKNSTGSNTSKQQAHLMTVEKQSLAVQEQDVTVEESTPDANQHTPGDSVEEEEDMSPETDSLGNSRSAATGLAQAQASVPTADDDQELVLDPKLFDDRDDSDNEELQAMQQQLQELIPTKPAAIRNPSKKAKKSKEITQAVTQSNTVITEQPTQFFSDVPAVAATAEVPTTAAVQATNLISAKTTPSETNTSLNEPSITPSPSNNASLASSKATESTVSSDCEDKEFVLMIPTRTRVALATQPNDVDITDLQFHGQEIPDGFGLYFFKSLRRVNDAAVKLAKPYGGKLILGELESGEPLLWPLNKVIPHKIPKSRSTSPEVVKLTTEDKQLKVVQQRSLRTRGSLKT